MKHALVLVLIILTLSCTKEQQDPIDKCLFLKEGMMQNDTSKMSAAINAFIHEMNDQAHTLENLNRLVGYIATACNVQASVACYLCITSNPGQSEIRITIDNAGSSLKKVVDITHSIHDPNQKMQFRNMHN